MNSIEEYRNFTKTLVGELNRLKDYYNPTNRDFEFLETHIDKEYYLELTIWFHDHKKKIIDHKYIYKEYRDEFIISCYKRFINDLLLHLIYSERNYSVKNIIKTIDTLEGRAITESDKNDGFYAWI